ncbi:MAG: endolytic transglycosylase MltG [Myxococcota bacterium]
MRLLTLAVALGLGAACYLLVVYPARAKVGAARSFSFQVPQGVGALAEALADEGVVDSAFLYGAYHRFVAGSDALREGPVLLARNLAPSEVLRRVVEGRGPVPVRVVIPEGFTRFDIGTRLEEAGVCARDAFLVATSAPPAGVSAPSAEGYLFPDTYELIQESSAEEVVSRLRDNFTRRVNLRSAHGLSEQQVLVLASIVEREAAVAGEQRRIAGVFLNRLRSTTFRPLHRLQADPTVAYGCVAEPGRA